MLALRNAVCNDRWREMWHKVLKEQQQQSLDWKARRKMPTHSLSAESSPSSLTGVSEVDVDTEHQWRECRDTLPTEATLV